MFGWFKRPKASTGPTPEWQERLEKAERKLLSLTDDWEEFHEKVQRAVWRAAKRKDPVEAPDLPEVAPEQPARFQLGSPRATVSSIGTDPLSAAIRARRGNRPMHDPAKLNGGHE